MKVFWLAISAGFLAVSCMDDKFLSPEKKVVEYYFQDNFQGWVPGFSGYPENAEQNFKLSYQHSISPLSLKELNKCIHLSGLNKNQDLFVFMKRPLGNLNPNTTYLVSFKLETSGSLDLPDLNIKAGAISIEPRLVIMEGNDGSFVRISIDKGSGASDGEQMKSLGSKTEILRNDSFKLIQSDNEAAPVEVRSNEFGEVWLIIGAEAGSHESVNMFINSIAVTIEKKV